MPPLLARHRHLVRAAVLGALMGLVPAAVADPLPAHRISICYAPGTPLETPDAMKAAIALYQAADDARWSRTAVDGPLLRRGEPTTLTWSIVPDGTPIPGYIGESSGASNLRSWLDGKYGSSSGWLPLFERVFARWSELSGVTYVYEPADDGSTLGDARGVRGVRADIRIGGHTIDGRNGTLAYDFFPDDGDMVIDTADRYFDSLSGDSLRLRNVIAHEHGHGLGLDHVCPVNGTKLMEPTSSTGIDGPQLDDILAVQRLYGDRFEDNETTATATPLGTLGSADAVVDDVSIDGSDDVDVYAFSGSAGGRVDVVLVPVGASYPQGAQSGNGSCSSGATYDALRRLDLSVELVGPDGTQRLAFADAAREGATEQIVGVALVSDAPHFVRVRGDGDDVQLYRLVVSVAAPAIDLEAVDDAVTTPQAVPARVNVLQNDAGVGAAAVTVSVSRAPSGGEAVAAGGGVVRYVPAPGFSGDDAFDYTVRNADGAVSTGTVSVTVEPERYVGDARVDSDGDLYPDELETALGSATGSSASRPAAGEPGTLVPQKVRALLRFRRSGRDELLVRGTITLPDGAPPAGTSVAVYAGGLTRRFTLDRRARGRDRGDTIRLSSARSGTAAFKLRVRRADLASAWADEGLLPETGVADEDRAVTLFVIVGTRASATNLPLRFTVRRDKGKPTLATD